MKKYKLILWNPKAYAQVANQNGTQFPPLGLGLLAALAPCNWDVIIYDETFDEFRVEECDLVGITAMTSQINRAYEIAELYRKQNIPVVLGGIHPTMCTDEALQYCDSVVKGEAELVWCDLLKDVEQNSLKKVYQTKELHDLKDLPKARHNLFNKKYKLGIMQTTRGCGMDCEFCSVTAFNGLNYRKRPIEDVLDELELIPAKFVLFADDNLIGFSKADHARFIELCEGIIRRKIKKSWAGQFPVTVVQNELLLEMASKAGCYAVLVGIESISENVLQGQMNKKFNSRILKDNGFVSYFHKYGIMINGMFIIGNEEDNKQTYDDMYKFIKQQKIDIPTISFLTPYPGTKLWKRVMDSQLVLNTNFPYDYRFLNGISYAYLKVNNMSTFEIEAGMKWLTRKNLSYFQIFVRSFRTILYTRKPISFILCFITNLTWRKVHFNASYFNVVDLSYKGL
ncbi:MAG: B12-binding domain-containing radical SAM protein [Bacteroidales bacterium]|nr:B12-binding domain-containing radical SAM protein [Bacteroidales bacterium]